MGSREIGGGTVDWIHLDQDNVYWPAGVNTALNVWVP